MKIELYIEGEKKTFTTPYVPMLAKRKYMQLLADAEEREGQPSYKDTLEEDEAIYAILSDVVFGGQFTLDELYMGNSAEYNKAKMQEAIFGKQLDDDEGNEKGE